MRCGWQVLACWVGLGAILQAQQVSPKENTPAESGTEDAPVAKFEWKAPNIGRGLFTDALGMLEREREEYAASLAAEASGRAMEGRGSKESLEQARKLLALALQLAPRSRPALVLNFQLSRGILPTQKPDGYSPEVLSKLLVTRSELLRKQAGEENLLMARAFVEIAAELDPKNEDAVYASEVQRLDHANVDWSQFTDPPK